MNNASQVFDNALEDFISAPEDTSPSLLPSLLKAAKAFAAATTNMIDMLKQIPEDAASAAQSNAKAAEDALKAFLDACNSFAPAADNETVTPTAADLEAIKRSGNNALAAANAAIDSTNLIAQGGVKGRIAFFEAEARRNAPKV